MSKPLKVKKVSAEDLIQATAARILRTRVKEFYSHWPDSRQVPTLEQLHNLRISGKRLRYSAEQLRELYPDRLALLIELLKRSQDLLGEIQDCVTQRAMIETELAKLERRKSGGQESSVLLQLVTDYDHRQQVLFTQYREIWMGLASAEFQHVLKVMVSEIAPAGFRHKK